MKKTNRNAINGWINLNKPLGITSSDAVNKVKWLLKPQKIGHAGTLDPLASGVLPLALGEGTKCVNLLMDAKKVYEFAVTFGERRSTDDAEGEVVATSQSIPTGDAIRGVLAQFTGEITQVPPIFSALKVDGKRAYDLARAGEEVVLKARQVTVYTLQFLGFEALEAFPPCGGRLDGGMVTSEHSTSSTPSLTLPARGRGFSSGEACSALRTEIAPEEREKIQHYAKDLRTNSTEVEKKLWRYLCREQLEGFKFRRQHPIDTYITDFACLEQRFVVELDGGQHSAEMDAKRTEHLQAQGFTVIRFWNHEVLENVEGVVEVIRTNLLKPLTQPSFARGEGSSGASSALKTAKFRATVSKGTYIRSLGRDIAQALGSEGYISRLHRAAVGPFKDSDAISLDFLAESVHKAPPNGELSSFVIPLHAALDDIPALALTVEQVATLRHGQQVTLADPYPDTPLLAALHQGELVGLVRVEGNQVISVRLLNT